MANLLKLGLLVAVGLFLIAHFVDLSGPENPAVTASASSRAPDFASPHSIALSVPEWYFKSQYDEKYRQNAEFRNRQAEWSSNNLRRKTVFVHGQAKEIKIAADGSTTMSLISDNRRDDGWADSREIKLSFKADQNASVKLIDENEVVFVVGMVDYGIFFRTDGYGDRAGAFNFQITLGLSNCVLVNR